MIRRFRAHPIPPKFLLGFTIFTILMLIGGLAYHMWNAPPKVTDFASCVAAGNPVLPTNPPQCTHMGESFFRPGEAPYNPKRDLKPAE